MSQDTHQATHQGTGQDTGQEKLASVDALVRDLDVPQPRPVSTSTTDERQSAPAESSAESTASPESRASVSTATSTVSRETVDVAEEARRTWREASDRDQPLTGAELGRLYERSERWGRDRINEARTGNPPATPRRTKKAETRSPARAPRHNVAEQPNPRPSKSSAAPSRPAAIEEPPSAGEHPQSEPGERGDHDDVARQVSATAEDLPQRDATVRDEELAAPPPPAAPAPAGPSPEQRPAAPPVGSVPEESVTAARRRWWAPWRRTKRATKSREHAEPAAAPAPAPTGRPSKAHSQPETQPSPQVQASAWVWWCAHIAVAIVAAVALVTSYDHMRILALKSGEGWRSWLLPISVDGLMIAASVTILARRRVGQRGGLLAWSALIGGVAASVAANVAGAHPDLVARLVAACPPLAALASVELLMQHIRLRATAAQQATHHAAAADQKAGDEAGTQSTGLAA